MMLLMAVAVFFVVRLVAGFFLAKKMQGAGAGNSNLQDMLSRMNQAQTGAQQEAPRQQPMPSAASAVADMPAASGSVMDTFATTAAVANGMVNSSETKAKKRQAQKNRLKPE
jgi:hypothetical protein